MEPSIEQIRAKCENQCRDPASGDARPPLPDPARIGRNHRIAHFA